MIFCTPRLPGSLCESFCDNEHCSAQGLRIWGGGERGTEETEPSSAKLQLCCGRERRERGQSPVGAWGCPHSRQEWVLSGVSPGCRAGMEAGKWSDAIRSSLSCRDAPGSPPRRAEKGSPKGRPPQEIPGLVLYVLIPLKISPKTPGLDCKMQCSLYRNNE